LNDIKTPPRTVGPIGSALMSVNGMIGAGLFPAPAILYSTLGSFAPWMILLVGVLVGAVILIQAELAAMFQQSGGPQLYVQAAFGPMLGFQAGWLLMLAIIVSRAANFHVLVSYLASIFPFFLDPFAHTIAVIALIAGLTWLSVLGMRHAVKGLIVGTILKLTPIIGLCLIAFAREGIATEIALPEFGAIEGTLLLISYAFSGADTNALAAGETRNPRRTIPMTMLGSLAAITILYMLVQFAFNAVAPETRSSETPLAAMGAALADEAGALAMAIAAIFSIATNQLTFYMSGPRVLFGMARRGLLPLRV
jgi:amino acid transporter